MKPNSQKHLQRSFTTRNSARLEIRADKIWNFDCDRFSPYEARIDEFRNLGALYIGINSPSQIKFIKYKG